MERSRLVRASKLSGGLRVARLFGIDIVIDASWFVIVALVLYSFGVTFQQTLPQLRPAGAWAAALAATLLFFASILIHELSHSVVAQARKLDVRAIRLFVFGGVSMIRGEPRWPKDELFIAAIGPITSLALGGIAYGIAAAGMGGPVVVEIAGQLAFLNFMLAFFNLAPGYPLDGGRVLRAIVWGITGDLARATRIAATVGMVFAWGLIGLGFALLAIAGNFISGIWLMFIGWFLLQAAQSGVVLQRSREVLDRALVDRFATSDCQRVEPDMTVRRFVDTHVLPTGRRCFFVAEEGRLLGLLTPHEVRKVRREDWDLRTVREAMVPIERVRSVSPGDSLLTAIERMDAADVNQLPVVDDGRLYGVLTREDVLHILATHLELGGRRATQPDTRHTDPGRPAIGSAS